MTTPAKAPRTPKAPKEVVAKTPSNISLGKTIFNEQLAKRASGEFTTNRDFRASVITRMQSELSVSVASAATMYNSAKATAEQDNPAIGLGRDPKKEKVAKAPRAKKEKAVAADVAQETATA